MEVPPDSEASDSGSQAPRDGEDADRRQTRERDLMRELDRVTGRRAGGATRRPGPHPLTNESGGEYDRAEEVPDE